MLAAFAVVLTSIPASAEVDLLASASDWASIRDHEGVTIHPPERTADALTVRIESDGGPEDYPRLHRGFPEPQDWSAATALVAKVRVDCDDPGITHQQLGLVVYDRNTLRADLPDHPQTQQFVMHAVPVGQWVTIRDWLVQYGRFAVDKLELYLYETSDTPHTYTWQFARLALETTDDRLQSFDRFIYPEDALQTTDTREPAHRLTAGNLALSLTDSGAIAAVAVPRATGIPAGNAVGRPPLARAGNAVNGLLVRDAATEDPPRMVGGTLESREGAITQTSSLDDLGLAVRAEYVAHNDRTEITGEVEDLTGRDRAVTVYFAVPLTEGNWTWWDSIAASRPAASDLELSMTQEGMACGANGANSFYPLCAMSLPGQGGLSLAVRMDEPVVHRFGYQPALRLLYVALDFGLAPVTNHRGVSLQRAPFSILLYDHDPAWGFRSALERYYRIFPGFFEKRVTNEGGWYVWGNMRDTPGALEGGLRFHWGPGDAEAVRYDNENGALTLNYIEPQQYQQTMGDFDRAPSVQEALDRLARAAAGDTEALEKLSYAQGGCGHLPAGAINIWLEDHSLGEFIQAISQATEASVSHDSAGRPQLLIGQYPWIGDSLWGAILPGNLDPDIPRGKGWFNREIALDLALKVWERAGVRMDGIGLDSFGGFGRDRTVNFRRDHFQYADVPLCFSTLERSPAIVDYFSYLEWTRVLAADMHAEGKVLMANCSWGSTPGFLTFAAPYLDIFGAEAAQFADPDFIRAIAYQKPCTDLPYTPRPEWEVKWHLLHGIFPGHGNDVAVLAKYAPLLRELAAAGWEPLTYARAEPSPLRVERFGHGKTLFLSLHNPTLDPVEATLTLDLDALGLQTGEFVNALTGEPVAVDRPLLLGAHDTVVLRPPS